MIQNYKNATGGVVDFFIKEEIKNTPMQGEMTLFVVGLQPIEKIMDTAATHNINHIYFGANMSFPKTDDFEYQFDVWLPWGQMVEKVLEEDLWATLDIDVSQVAELHGSGLSTYSKFIPMISVKLPQITSFNDNATIKIDDSRFNKSNPGVWCWKLDDLMSKQQFTDWEEYGKDAVI